MVSASFPGSSLDKVWIQADKSTGVYRLDDGTPMKYFNWNTYQPSSAGTEEPYIFINVATQYMWHDMDDSSSFQALCQVV